MMPADVAGYDPARSGFNTTELPILAAPRTDEKRFKTAQAMLAGRSMLLHRTDARDGQVTYFVTRWAGSLCRELPTLDAAEALALQVAS